MCPDSDCPDKNQCKRHTATPNPSKQTWTIFHEFGKKGVSCMFFIENGNKVYAEGLQNVNKVYAEVIQKEDFPCRYVSQKTEPIYLL